MKLRKYLYFLTNCKNLEELWAAHCEQMDEFGFDRMIYGFTRYRTKTSLGDPEDFTILSNHHQDYVDGFPAFSGLVFPNADSAMGTGQ